MLLSNRWKLISLMITFITIGIFWNYGWIQPLKLIVVFLHEVSHAIGALLTGGSVESIFISWDESGYTATTGGDFLTIASAGYIGCILWGSLMLFTSLSSKYVRYYSVSLGILISFFALRFSSNVEVNIYFLILIWSIFFIITGVLFQNLSRYALFYMGGITSLYGVFDLFDFFRGSIDTTDAGKIASHYVKEPFLANIMAYAIALLISIMSVWILYRIIKLALRSKREVQADAPLTEECIEESSIDNPVLFEPKLIHKFQKITNQ